MSKTHLPGANRTAQYWGGKFVGSKMDTNCACIHTTETPGWPGYGGGASAPHLTVLPNIKAKTVSLRQHFPGDRSARALVNLTGGVETNTLHVFQIELIGTCDPKYRVSRKEWGRAGVDYIYWPDAPDWLLSAILPIFEWLDAEWDDFKLVDATPRGWAAYPGSYGTSARQRMSFAEWRGAFGIFGHQHVPENTHGDPGNFPMKRMLELAKGAAPTPEPPPVVPPVGPPAAGTHVVVRDDTLSDLARKYGVTVAQLAAWNAIGNPNEIRPGQVLKVKAPATTPKPPTQPAPATQDASVLTLNVASRNATVAKALGPWWQRVLRIAAFILKIDADAVVLQECYAEHRGLLDKLLAGVYQREATRGGRVIYRRIGRVGVQGTSFWVDLMPGKGTKYAISRKLVYASGAVLNLADVHLSYETNAVGVAKRAKEVPALIAWHRKNHPTGYDLYAGDMNAPFGSTTRRDDVGPLFAARGLHDFGDDVDAKPGRGNYHLDRFFAGVLEADEVTVHRNDFSDHPGVVAKFKIPTK